MKVIVAEPIDNSGLDLLKEAGHEVELAYNSTETELLDLIKTASGLIVRSGTSVTRTLIEAASNLIIVGRAGVGIDNIDLDAASDNGVIVVNAPEGNILAAAEHTVAMTFAIARKIPQAHISLNAGKWEKKNFIGLELNGKTAGIVGLGRVGQEVAKRFLSLGMNIVAFDPYISQERADQLGITLSDLSTCIVQADVLTIHTPLTPETKDLIGKEELKKLKGGYLINCARGGIVNELALAEAISNGVLAGAAIDVFSEEPVSPDNPLLGLQNVIVTPHLGASTEAAQENVSLDVTKQVIAALSGNPVENSLNSPSIDEATFSKIYPYIGLIETAGNLAIQLLTKPVTSIELTYSGEIASLDVSIATASALKGVFTSLEWRINSVNALRVAQERGVSIQENKNPHIDGFQSLVSVTLRSNDKSICVECTVFANDDPRIVRIDGFRIDAIPSGHVLISRNIDSPGVIGFIGTVLGEHKINIAAMFNSRENIGGGALTVYNIDDPISEDIQKQLKSDDRITDIYYISLTK